MNRRGYAAVTVLIAAALTVILVFTLNRPEPEAPAVPEPKAVIALDAGHGGRDPGAVVGDVLEKDLNLEIIQRVQTLIDGDPTLRAVMVRSVDEYVALEDRITRAEQRGATIYLSLHTNSFDQPGASGIETWVDSARSADDPSRVLASLVQDTLSEETGARNRGVKSQELYLRRTAMPAISVEVGYMTNPEELEKLLDPAYQEEIASAILSGIQQFLTWQDGQNQRVGDVPA